MPAQLIGSRTMVPARAVSEAFDARVGWIEESWAVTIVTDRELIKGIEMLEAFDKVIVKFEYDLELQGLETQAVVELGRQKTGDKFSFSRTKIIIPEAEMELEEIVSTNGIWTYKKDAEGNRTRIDEVTDIGVDKIIRALTAECELSGFVKEQNDIRAYKSVNNVVIVVTENSVAFATSAESLGIENASGDEVVSIMVYEETDEALRAWYNSMPLE